MTLFELRRLTRLWQKRLRITDWSIDISFGTPEEMGDTVGNTQYAPRQMTAIIRIDPDQGDTVYPDGGMEQTLIHELLHLTLHGDTEFKRENIMMERGINLTADALYRAYRRKLKGSN